MVYMCGKLYVESLHESCELSQLWYREFFLEMTMGKRIQVRDSFHHVPLSNVALKLLSSICVLVVIY